jgi:hypothetical protein
MLFDPDQGLGKIKVTFLKGLGVIFTVGVSAPNVKRSAWKKHSSDVSEPEP